MSAQLSAAQAWSAVSSVVRSAAIHSSITSSSPVLNLAPLLAALPMLCARANQLDLSSQPPDDDSREHMLQHVNIALTAMDTLTAHTHDGSVRHTLETCRDQLVTRKRTLGSGSV